MAEKAGWWVKDERPSLRLWIFTQMTLGAAYAALVLAALIFFILFLKALSGLLPEDPFAALEIGTTIATRLV